MLLQLNISNFALIEALSISFEGGLNILSGETGAGKSILIDAINYVLGVKFSKNLIRTGENKTYVEAIFTIENDKTIEKLESNNIEYEDMVIISREAFQSGKTIAKVNGKTVLLSLLKEISVTLMDIHGQHENQALMNPENHIGFLDNYGEALLSKSKTEFKKYYDELKAIDAKINELTEKTGDKDKVIDFLKYQLDEIDSANLKPLEDTELEERYAIISNSETISKVLSDSYERLYNGNDESLSIFDNLGVIIKELRTVEKHSEKIKTIAASLEEVYYNIEQNVTEIRTVNDNIEFDDRELEAINNRIYAIDALKKKYGKTLEEISAHREKIKVAYEQLLNCADIIKELAAQKEKLHKDLFVEAKKIHSFREKLAKELETKVMQELKYIGLEKSIFKIEVNYSTEYINDEGCDRVQFFITTNPGEPLKPLEKIVSGGELSRIMLAVKTVFVDKDKIPSVIFDEIDTGISGRIAQSVAEKMYIISKLHQVFCVTHLPQIASMSDIHYLVEKQISNGKTYTLVSKLSKEGKENAIAKMLGGSELTKITLDHAKEMIKLADNSKKNLI